MPRRCLLLGLVAISAGASPPAGAQGTDPRADSVRLVVMAGAAWKMGAHGRVGVEWRRLGAQVRGTRWQPRLLGDGNASSLALIATYTIPVEQQGYVRVGVGRSRFVHTAGPGVPGRGPTRRSAPGLPFEFALGTNAWRFVALEGVLLGDLNRVETLWGIGGGVGVRW